MAYKFSQLRTKAGVEDYTLILTLNEADYTMSVSMTDAGGNIIQSNTIDLPMESVVVGGKEENGNIILTLQNGNTISFSIGHLVNGLVSTETFNGHTTNKSNPHGVTAEQVGAAARSHTQSASTIEEGVFRGVVYAKGDGQDPFDFLLRNSMVTSASDITPAYNGEICWIYE